MCLLEMAHVRRFALEDPLGYLEAHPDPVIFDEAQNAPELLSYVKERIGADRDNRGRYVLSASQNLLLAEKMTQSLAGRTAVLTQLPLLRREIDGRRGAALPWEGSSEDAPAKRLAFSKLSETLLVGGYPEPVTRKRIDPHLWHSSYLNTYVERDVRSLRQVGDLSLFLGFLQALAVRSRQLLNLTDISRDLGVAVNTTRAWLSVLQATHQATILRPYFTNIGKRLVKRPKVYFTDPGTLCAIAGLRDPDHAAFGPLGGAVFETAVLGEISKALTNRGIPPVIYFWRTTQGQEVDFLVRTNGKLVPIEVKLSATPHIGMANSIRAFQKDFGDLALPGYLMHPGEERMSLGRGVTALPFSEL